MKFTDEEGNKYKVHAPWVSMVNEQYLIIKPLKEAEKKEKLHIQIWTEGGSMNDYLNNVLTLTPDTAKKVAEAFNKGVNFITTTGKNFQDADFTGAFMTARESFMEEQDD